jgi:hypothetical protein
MEGLINCHNEGLLKEIALMPNVCNTLWGSDYFMMDSPNFMGKKSGEQYDTMIDMFIKIWYKQRKLQNTNTIDLENETLY